MLQTSSRRPLVLLGCWLLGTLALAFLFLGSVSPDAQIGLHLLVACGAAIALFIPDRKLESAGLVLRWAIAGSLPLAALAVGLLPVPRAVATWVAPGLLSAHPDAAWMTLATNASRVPGEISTLTLVLGFGALVGVWGASRYRRDEAEAALTIGTGVLALSALLHAASGATTVLGIVVPAHAGAPFYAPLVNRDHAAAIMLLGGPIAAGMALHREHSGWTRAGAALVAAAAVAVIAAVQSSGAAVAGAAVVILWVLRGRDLHHLWVVALAVTLAIGVELFAGSVAIDDGSANVRAVLWRDASHLISDAWLAGSGGGTFGDAIRAYRSDYRPATFSHAHSDPLEWLTETGAVDVVAALAAAVALWPGPLRETRRGDGLAFGLLALGLHALVDFPLQIPAISMAAAGVCTCLLGVFTARRAAAPRAVRRVIVAVGLVQLPAAAWQARDAFVTRSLTDVLAFDTDPTRALRGAENLDLARAGGAERQLLEAWKAEARTDPEAAVAIANLVRDTYPDRPGPLRAAGFVLARAGRYEGATAALQRVTERDRADFRAWVALAHIAHAQGDDRLSADRWVGAFLRSAPGLDEAYATLPLGLFWLRALREVDARYSAMLSRTLMKAGDLDVALMACDQAADLNRAAFGEVPWRAEILVKLGRAEEAGVWLEDILSRHPDDPHILAEKGKALTALGRHDEATAAYLRGARSMPFLKVLALRSAMAAGGPERALELVHRFEIDGPMDPDVGLEIASVRMRAGEPARCVQDIERWNLVTRTVGPRAGDLLAACRAGGRR